MDLGECAKVHEYALRADFERSQKDKDYFYDVDVSLGNHIQRYILWLEIVMDPICLVKFALHVCLLECCCIIFVTIVVKFIKVLVCFVAFP